MMHWPFLHLSSKNIKLTVQEVNFKEAGHLFEGRCGTLARNRWSVGTLALSRDQKHSPIYI